MFPAGLEAAIKAASGPVTAP